MPSLTSFMPARVAGDGGGCQWITDSGGSLGFSIMKPRVITLGAGGLTITQYVMGLVWPDAERRVAENHRVKLSPRDWKAFAERLDAPPA